MDTKNYNQIQSLRKQLHESKKNNINENTNTTVETINEQLINVGCGTKQINE